ncbi:tetratricopeptide repeat protein [Roseateles sp. DC23W]|uniref:Tetratricopeptide repeat protein n=1 Tax=Pelomonas dachongensis TaxID=3299029 RepID=A0ABW7ELY5_9BURK
MRVARLTVAVLLAASLEQVQALPPPRNPALEAQALEAQAAVLRAAAQAGDAAVQWQLGRLLRWGQPKEALAWLRKAAAQGHEEALLYLCDLLLSGSAGEKDPQEALGWLRQAAQRGSANAQVALGDALSQGAPGDGSEREGAAWYRRAAEQGNAFAQQKWGLALRLGTGVGKDEPQAFEWLLKSAEAGDVLAQLEVADMLQKGEGTAMDEVVAVRWLQRAADNSVGPELAAYPLGRCFELGLGVNRDVNQAAQHYRRGARAGDGRSQRQLARLLLAGQPTSLDRMQAYAWLSLAMQSVWAFGFDKDELVELAVRLTPAEKAQAESLASQWRLGAAIGVPPGEQAVRR